MLIAYWQPVASGKVSQSRQKTLPDAFERFSSCLAGQNWSAQLRVGSKPWRQAEHQKSQSYEWMCASPKNSVTWHHPIYLVIQITYSHWMALTHHIPSPCLLFSGNSSHLHWLGLSLCDLPTLLRCNPMLRSEYRTRLDMHSLGRVLRFRLHERTWSHLHGGKNSRTWNWIRCIHVHLPIRRGSR